MNMNSTTGKTQKKFLIIFEYFRTKYRLNDKGDKILFMAIMMGIYGFVMIHAGDKRDKRVSFNEIFEKEFIKLEDFFKKLGLERKRAKARRKKI